jgi:hypothetical protein
VVPGNEHGRQVITAWAYLQCPVWYRHAEGQWTRRLTLLAERDGIIITRWWVDHAGRSIDAVNMLHHMEGSGVQALLLPYPQALAHLPDCRDLSPEEIGRWLHLRVIVLDPVMTITPEGDPDLGLPNPPHRSCLARLRRRRAS